MSIQLTPQQQQALDAQGGGHPPRVIDPRTNAAYVLVPEGDYDAVREHLEEEQRQRAIRAVALRNAAGRMSPVEPRDDWERRLFGAALDCGVSVPDSALSSDRLYE